MKMLLFYFFKQIDVITSNGQLKSVTIENNSPSLSSLTEQITSFIISVIFWIVGLFVFYKRPRKQAALLFCLCGLVVGLILTTNAAAERIIPGALQLTIISATVGPWMLAHFFHILPEERTRLNNRNLIYLIYIPALIFIVLFPIFGYAEGQPLPLFRDLRLFEYGAGFLTAAGIMIFNYFHAGSTAHGSR